MKRVYKTYNVYDASQERLMILRLITSCTDLL
jgi:hypothetical protein